MTEEIHFILHVANGIYIIIHNVDRYNYMHTNTSIFIRILVSISLILQILFCRFLENDNRYGVEILNVH